ncbi:MAG: hypothetical protein U9Q07_01330 [Planctomycetota bacterium]|nr:hypothetical protein [Planctomycetota bacterium]
MKHIENTENFVRHGKANVATDPQMDRRVLNDSLAAMDEATGSSSATRVMLRSRAAKLAAAAAIIIAVGLLIIQSNPPEQEHAPTRNVAKSPAEMLSVMSLTMAYRRGGIEALDDQSSEAFDMLGSQPTKVSVRELLAESNGV